MITWQPLEHDPQLNTDVLIALKGVREPVKARFFGTGFILLSHQYLGNMLLKNNARIMGWSAMNLPEDYVRLHDQETQPREE